jgi:urea transport system substrate-binding protein
MGRALRMQEMCRAPVAGPTTLNDVWLGVPHPQHDRSAAFLFPNGASIMRDNESDNEQNGSPPSQSRRRLMQGLAALPALPLAGMAAQAHGANLPTGTVNTTRLAVTDTEVTVGQLHSATGTMAISETGSIQAEQLAIDQINAAGGILGRKIKVIKEDGASDWPTFAEKSRKLLVNDRVAAVFGCWTSASRKAVLPVFEKENGLLYYPTFYEGLEQSKNVIYTGQEATQQIIWGLDWAAKQKNAKSFFLIGSDYIWPRTSNKIARKHIEGHLQGCKVVGEEYYPLGTTNFNSLINKIKIAKPDCIYAIIVGGSNVAFYKQLKAAGITADKQFLLTISVTEDEVLGIGGENVAGFYSAMKYFESLDNENNKKFVAAFKAKYGPKSVIGDVTQAAYLGPWLWKAAVEKAGSFDVDKVVAASPGIELKTAPEGYVKIHANHHLWSRTRIGQAQADGQFKVVAESPDLIEPNPFPKGYQ